MFTRISKAGQNPRAARHIRPDEGAFEMDIMNPVIQLCMEGTRAESERRLEDARALYEQAWNVQTNHYESCIAAHHVARFQNSAAKSVHWNHVALSHANAVTDERVKDFYPSLFLVLGCSYEAVGDEVKAKK